MKVSMIFALLVFAAGLLAGQSKAYVCMPCGQDCDREIRHAGGTCPGCGMALVEKSTVTFTNLSLEELCARLAANPDAVLLDVRSPQEFTGTVKEIPSYGHFRNAININIDELPARVGELTALKDREILVYCSHSHRSPRASYFLSTHGFKNVKNVAGGVSTFVGLESKYCLRDKFISHR